MVADGKELGREGAVGGRGQGQLRRQAADSVFESQQLAGGHRAVGMLPASTPQFAIATSLRTRPFEVGSAEIASGLTPVNSPTCTRALADASHSISAA